MRPNPTEPRRLRSCPDPRHPEQGDPLPLEQRDDDELMQLAALGVERAFELLIRRHQRALRGYCARLCGPAGADDVAQEALLTVWNLRGSYEARGHFRAYLFTIAERRCMNAQRSRRRASAREERAGHEERDPSHTPLDELLASERQRKLYESVNKLAREQRRAILLHYAGGLDYEEIALVTERPAATIRTRVFQGLLRLRKLAPRGKP